MLNAYSPDGLLYGTKSGKYYIKFEEKVTGLEKVSSLSTKEYDFIGFTQVVNQYSKNVYNTLIRTGLLTLIPGYAVEYNPKLLSVSPTTGYNGIILFPSKFTNFYAVDIKGGFANKRTPMDPTYNLLAGNSGNSYFIASISLSTTDIMLNHKEKKVTLSTFVNLNSLTWVDGGQDVSVNTKKAEEDKKLQVDSEEALVLSLALNVVTQPPISKFFSSRGGSKVSMEDWDPLIEVSSDEDSQKSRKRKKTSTSSSSETLVKEKM